MPQILKNYVAGAFREGKSETWAPDINPSDAEDVIALVPQGTVDDVTSAVQAAQEALPKWRSLTGPVRADYLYRWAEAVAARHEYLAQAVAREVGKPITEARGEVTRCVTLLRYYAGEAVREIGEVIPSQLPGALQFTLREPLGVVALITPWNFPLAIPLWKVAPALAFGNTVVLKPAETASHVATLLAETAASAQLPSGVFNVVLGTGSVIGEPLLRAEEVRAVSFTGSSAVGARVAAIAAERNIRFQTEMGGKNVAIVARDADLDLAASLTSAGAMRYAGQKCTATSRVVVDKTIKEPFLEKLIRQIEALPLGPVTDPNAVVGPLISHDARQSIRQVLDTVTAERVVAGVLPDDDHFNKGFYFAPTLVAGVDPDSILAQQELFGPVLASIVADDFEQAIELANRTPYGLSASIFTKDVQTALRYVNRIEAGLVRVNGDTTGVDPHAPFGGMKGSSSGSREQGQAAREFYTEIKTVQISG